MKLVKKNVKDKSFLMRIVRKTYFVAFLASLLSLNVSAQERDKFDGDTYLKNSEFQKVSAEGILGNIDLEGKEEVTEKGKEEITEKVVLDLGCGPLNVALECILPRIKASVVHLIGVDSSDSMIEKAKETSKNTPNVTLIKKSIQDFNTSEYFKDKTKRADITTCLMAFHWVPEDKKEVGVENIANSLKKGGLFIASMVPFVEGLRVQSVANDMKKEERWAHFFKDYKDPLAIVPADEIRPLLKKHGLKEVYFKVTTAVNNIPSNEALYMMIKGISLYEDCLGDKHKEFWLEAINKYRELDKQPTEQEQKSVNYTSDVLVIVATKE